MNNVEKDFILNNDGEDRWVMNVEGKPEIFGVIEKEYTKSKSMFVFSIKYYWNKVLQDTKYADDLESAENKLKDILGKVDTKVKEKEMEVQYEMKNIKSFESFLAGELPDLSKDFDPPESTKKIFDKPFYDNPENLSPDEIHTKLKALKYGENRNKRFWKLLSYNTDKITKDEYKKKYTSK